MAQGFTISASASGLTAGNIRTGLPCLTLLHIWPTMIERQPAIWSTINGHAVVVATCPPGETGDVNAGRLTGPNIHVAVLVGIRGGILSLEVSEDVHLSNRQFEIVGTTGNTDQRQTTTFANQAIRPRRCSALKQRISSRTLGLNDKLFKAAYHHTSDYRSKCTTCDLGELIQWTHRHRQRSVPNRQAAR